FRLSSLPASYPVRCVISFNHTPTTEIYTLSLHDALPIFLGADRDVLQVRIARAHAARRRHRLVEASVDAAGLRVDLPRERVEVGDRKSTRLNSSHVKISYAVFCLKKKIINDVCGNPCTHY